MKSSISPELLASTSFRRRSEALDLDFRLKPGNQFASVAATPEGRQLEELLQSEGMVLVLAGAVLQSPMRSPVATTVPFIEHYIGNDALDDDEFKRLVGRYLRQIIEHIGGAYRRSRVPIKAVGSPFQSGSTYTFHSVSIQ